MSNYRGLLLEISNNLTSSDLDGLKFLCREVIPAGRAERITRSFEFFSELEHLNMLSEENRDFLASKLIAINRNDLRNKLLGIQENAPQIGQGQVPSVQPNVPTGLYDGPVPVTLVYDLVEDLSINWKMLGRRLGLSEGILTNIETEHKRVVEKGVAMFEEWKKRNTAAATMKALREGLEKIGRRDLSEKVRDFALREQQELLNAAVEHEQQQIETVETPFPNLNDLGPALPGYPPLTGSQRQPEEQVESSLRPLPSQRYQPPSMPPSALGHWDPSHQRPPPFPTQQATYGGWDPSNQPPPALSTRQASGGGWNPSNQPPPALSTQQASGGGWNPSNQRPPTLSTQQAASGHWNPSNQQPLPLPTLKATSGYQVPSNQRPPSLSTQQAASGAWDPSNQQLLPLPTQQATSGHQDPSNQRPPALSTQQAALGGWDPSNQPPPALSTQQASSGGGWNPSNQQSTPLPTQQATSGGGWNPSNQQSTPLPTQQATSGPRDPSNQRPPAAPSVSDPSLSRVQASSGRWDPPVLPAQSAGDPMHQGPSVAPNLNNTAPQILRAAPSLRNPAPSAPVAAAGPPVSVPVSAPGDPPNQRLQTLADPSLPFPVPVSQPTMENPSLQSPPPAVPSGNASPIDDTSTDTIQAPSVSSSRPLHEPSALGPGGFAGQDITDHVPNGGVRASVPVSSALRAQLTSNGNFLDPEKYEPIKLIGSGGFAKVYLCICKSTGRRMAVKMCDLGMNHHETQKQTQAVSNEVKVLSAVKHKYIVQFFYAEENQNTLLLFLEYLEGGSVEDMLRHKGPMQELLVRKFTRQILTGVDFLHNNGIIHKDIKGGNVLLDEHQMNIKLADFGISKVMTELKTVTGGRMTKNNIASFHWTSPELLSCQHYGRKTDIWSVGCTVVEMLTTKPPLFDEHLDMPQKMYKIVNHQVEPPKDCTSLAFGFLTKCLSKCDVRPSAAELLETDPFVKFSQEELMELLT